MVPSSQKGKQEERRHVERFIESYPAFPAGDRHFAGDSEVPDLTVDRPRGKLGVEHTRLLIPGEAEQESLQDRVMARAQRFYEEGGGLALIVHAHFDDRVHLMKCAINGEARLLASAMEGAPADAWELPSRDPFNYAPDGLPACVLHVNWVLAAEPSKARWTVTRAGCLRDPTEAPKADDDRCDPIQEAICHKSTDEARLKRYRSECAETWLLLVCDGFAPSSWFDLPALAKAQSYPSPFDKTIIFESFDKSVHELPTVPWPGACPRVWAGRGACKREAKCRGCRL